MDVLRIKLHSKKHLKITVLGVSFDVATGVQNHNKPVVFGAFDAPYHGGYVTLRIPYVIGAHLSVSIEK